MDEMVIHAGSTRGQSFGPRAARPPVLEGPWNRFLPPKKAMESIKYAVIDRLREVLRLGIIRMSDHLRGDKFDSLGLVSHWDVYKAFQGLYLLKYRGPPPPHGVRGPNRPTMAI